MKKLTVLWMGVQPTSYNHIFYEALKKSSRLDVKICYSLKSIKLNPYEEKYFDSHDYFFNRKSTIDINILRLGLKKDIFVVSSGWNDKTKLFVLLLRAILGLPYAIWTDSINPNNYMRKSLSFIIKSFLCKKATILFTTGEFGVQKIVQSGLINNGKKIVSLPFFVKLPDQQSSKVYDCSPFIVLQLCRLVEGKGVETSIEAFKILKEKGYSNIKLFIGGTGPNEQKYKEMIRKYQLEHLVQFTGWMNAEKLSALRKQTLLAIHPVNDHDPFPLVVLESLANGIPVVGSTLAGSVVDRLVEHRNGFKIPPNSPGVLVEKILILYNDRELLKQQSIFASEDAQKWPVSRGVQIVEEALRKFL